MPLLGTAAGARAGAMIAGTPGGSAVGRALNFSFEYNTDGLDQLIAKSPELADHALAYVAHRSAARARINIRAVEAIDTSYMVNTTRARRVSRYLWSIGTAAYYGVFVEFGTVHMGGRPWLIPAMLEAFDLFEAILKQALPGLARGQVNVPDGGGE